jgi:hypothetical protein
MVREARCNNAADRNRAKAAARDAHARVNESTAPENGVELADVVIAR